MYVYEQLKKSFQQLVEFNYIISIDLFLKKKQRKCIVLYNNIKDPLWLSIINKRGQVLIIV